MSNKLFKWIKNNFIDIIALLSNLFLLKMNEQVFRILLFINFILLFVALFILGINIYSKYEYRNKKMNIIKEKSKNDENFRFKYSYYKDKIYDDTKKIFQKKICASWVCIFILLANIFFVCITNMNYLKVYIDDARNLFGFSSVSDELIENDSFDENNKNESNSNKIDEPPRMTLRNRSYRFIIDQKNDIFSTDRLREQRVFLFSDVYGNNIDESAHDLVFELKSKEMQGINSTELSDDLGNSQTMYNSKEDDFLEMIEYAAGFNYQEEWEIYAPHSTEYNEIIKGRERLTEIAEGDKVGNYMTWWDLANDYQLMAIEYELQTDNSSAVLYYYTNCIYCCMKAMEYSITDEQYAKIYHYMVMRYHDIYRDECIISYEYKVRAHDIFVVLVKDDVLFEGKY